MQLVIQVAGVITLGAVALFALCIIVVSVYHIWRGC